MFPIAIKKASSAVYMAISLNVRSTMSVSSVCNQCTVLTIVLFIFIFIFIVVFVFRLRKGEPFGSPCMSLEVNVFPLVFTLSAQFVAARLQGHNLQEGDILFNLLRSECTQL